MNGVGEIKDSGEYLIASAAQLICKQFLSNKFPQMSCEWTIHILWPIKIVGDSMRTKVEILFKYREQLPPFCIIAEPVPNWLLCVGLWICCSLAGIWANSNYLANQGYVTYQG